MDGPPLRGAVTRPLCALRRSSNRWASHGKESPAIADRTYVLEHGVFALAGPAAALMQAPRLQQTYPGL
jgi:hypothetical protein